MSVLKNILGTAAPIPFLQRRLNVGNLIILFVFAALMLGACSSVIALKPLKGTNLAAAKRLQLEQFNARKERGWALCLSGGGYRAMLFHAGVLNAMNWLGNLPRFKQIAGVSGGSITLGQLASRWHLLDFQNDNTAVNFRQQIIDPLLGLAGETIDLPAAVAGFLPGTNSSVALADYLDSYLYRGFQISDIGVEAARTPPQFIFMASEMRTRDYWMMASGFMGGLKSTLFVNYKMPISYAVAASASYPVVFIPLRLDLSALDRSDIRVKKSGVPEKANRRALFKWQRENADAIASEVVLVDGGVKDNRALGMCERVADIKRKFIADARLRTKRSRELNTDRFTMLSEVLDTLFERAESANIRKFEKHNDLWEYFKVYNRKVKKSDYSTCDHCLKMRDLNEFVASARLIPIELEDMLKSWWKIRKLITIAKNIPVKMFYNEKNPLHDINNYELEIIRDNIDKAVDLASIETRLKFLGTCEREHLVNMGHLSTLISMETTELMDKLFAGARFEGEVNLDFRHMFLPFPIHPALLPKDGTRYAQLRKRDIRRSDCK